MLPLPLSGGTPIQNQQPDEYMRKINPYFIGTQSNLTQDQDEQERSMGGRSERDDLIGYRYNQLRPRER